MPKRVEKTFQGSKKTKIKVIHGPNLNLLGQRQINIYGTTTLAEINKRMHAIAQSKNVSISFFQSNSEGELVDCIQQSFKADGIIINAAAYTHTSIAIRDALLSVAVPFVEVHLSNIKKREKFRKHSYLSDVALKVVMGLGAQSYYRGLCDLIAHLT
ncbi:MAG: type II 3-dehydroquinate dehydratase [Deltaproteobacteria bacterium]|nr:type II 3-dehydroquinate dehydratase [Deltaproteobacteria bacterium]